MSLSSFFSSFVGTLYADAPEESEVVEAEPQEVEEVVAEVEVEEEEPEDIHPQLREEAQESTKCKAAAHHFFHCQEKVQSGKGFQHEDCVEEMFHMMHCTDNELAPKLFAKLR
ncbi:ubiquinol-cytochrome C reductase hinge domain-containing protein [Lactarius quietus]|nr:ubiquinol-cytochrome C reductase hinge domain-containing protein [Lactarius quietus]